MHKVAKEAPTFARRAAAKKMSSDNLMKMEGNYAARNYAPMPVVFDKAQGTKVWDPEGKEYTDFLSAYSATNQGHNHPRIVAAMKDQLDHLALSSRAFYNSVFPQFAQYMSDMTGYSHFLPANSGAEAVEAAIKMARKWGYAVKGIPENEAIIIVAKENFHGRTISIVSFSTDPDAWHHYGPFTPGFEIIDFDDVSALEAVLEKHGKNVAAFMVEPIQGEAGVFVPKDGYLKSCYELCKKHNVLLMSDEVQTGFGRTGKLFCSDYDEIKPDVIIVGKALSGGLYPVSGVLADKEAMGVFTPGTHGSTFGGSPIASAVAIEAMTVLVEEGMVENSYELGQIWRADLGAWAATKEDHKVLVRGRGLLNAIEVDETLLGGKFAYRWCVKMSEEGLLAKPTHGNIVRFSPPLVITKEEVVWAIDVIKKCYDATMEEAKAASA